MQNFLAFRDGPIIPLRRSPGEAGEGERVCRGVGGEEGADLALEELDHALQRVGNLGCCCWWDSGFGNEMEENLSPLDTSVYRVGQKSFS